MEWWFARILALRHALAAVFPDEWSRLMVTESEFDAMVVHENCYYGYFCTSDILLIFWNYELRFLAKPKKANFQPFTLLLVLRWGYNSWVRLLETLGNDWHGAVHPALCVRGFFKFGESPKMGSTLKAIKNFSKWYVFTWSTLSDIFAKFGSDTCCGLRISTVKLLLKLKTRFFRLFLGAVEL